MDRPRLIRWLRIAVSAVCVVVCVGLIGLWATSFWWVEILSVRVGSHARHIWCIDGYFYAFTPGNPEHVDFQFRIKERSETDLGMGIEKNRLGFGILTSQDGVHVVLPIWSSVLLSATVGMMAAAPLIAWRSIRYSLGTLLIVTTLVALLLGYVVWAVR